MYLYNLILLLSLLLSLLLYLLLLINYYVVYVFINYNYCCQLSRDVYRQLRCTDHDDDDDDDYDDYDDGAA